MAKAFDTSSLIGKAKTAKPERKKTGQGTRALSVEQQAAGKVSPYQSDLRAKVKDTVQLNFGRMPRFIVEIMDQQAEAAGMNRRHYLFSLLREKGGNIPQPEDMDGRRL